MTVLEKLNGTPGRWRATENLNGYQAVFSGKMAICTIDEDFRESLHDHEKAVANAKMIAKAPELCGALIELIIESINNLQSEGKDGRALNAKNIVLVEETTGRKWEELMLMFRCDRCQKIFIIENLNKVQVDFPQGDATYDLCTGCLKHLKEALEPVKDFNADDCHFCHGTRGNEE